MIIFSDLHLKEETADTVFHEVLPGLLKAAEEHNDPDLVCLGDWWHIRYRVPVVLQNKVHAWLRELTQHSVGGWAVNRRPLNLRLLPGNHDQVDAAGENALQVFEGIPNVYVYSQPTQDADGVWIPYRKNPADIEAALARFPVKQGTTLFLHHGIRGAWMNDNRQDTEGLPIGMFQGWGKIWCGHYHKRQNVGRNLFYVGSPYQTNASEAGQPKGYTVVRGDQFQHVTTEWGKRYYIFELDKAGLPDLTGVRQGDEVRITTKRGVKAEKIGAAMADMGYLNVVVTPEVEFTENRLAVGPQASLPQFARAYVAEKVSGPEGAADRYWRVFQEITGVAS